MLSDCLLKTETSKMQGSVGRSGDAASGVARANLTDKQQEERRDLSGGRSTKRDSLTSAQREARRRHKTYVRNECRIQEEVFRAVAKRDISTRASDICKQTGLSMPTFYLHHRDCNEVLSSYEDGLLTEFRIMLLDDFNRIDIFNSLLIFIKRHQKYFWACFVSQNLYLLTKVLLDLQKYLVGPEVGRKTYVFYCSSVMALLLWWGRAEMFSKELIPEYTRQLKNLRLVYYK